MKKLVLFHYLKPAEILNLSTSGLVFFLIIFFSLGFFSSSIAQSYYKVNHFSPDIYQAGNQNWDMSIDEEGTVYLANNKGLLVLDGTESKLYETTSKTIVRSVFSFNKRVYTGSFEEFGYWEKDDKGMFLYSSLSANITKETLKNQEFWKITLHEGKIYFQSFGALFYLENNELRQLEIPGSILFLLDSGDRLFVQQIGGLLYEIIQNEFVPIKNSEPFSSTEVKSAIALSPQKILFGTSSKGLFVLEGSNFKPFPNEAQEALKTSILNNGIKIGNRLIFGTILQGIYILRIDGTLENHLNSSNYLQNNTILSLISDDDNNLWAGLDKGFDFIWFGSPFENYHEPDVDIGSVYAAALYKSKLYIGTNQGIYTFELDKSGTFINPAFIQKSQGQVWFIREIDGLLYCGLNEGTYLISDDQLIEVSDINGGYNLEPYQQFHEIRLQSTYNEIVVFDKTKGYWSKRNVLKGVNAPQRFLASDHLGNLLLGHTIKGLYLVKPNKRFDSVISYSQLNENNGLSFTSNRLFPVDNRILIPSGDSIFQWDAMNEKIIAYTDLNQQLGSFAEAKNILNAGQYKYWLIKDTEIGLFEIRFGTSKLLYRILPDLYDLNLIEDYEQIIPLNDSLHVFCLEDGFAILNINRLNRLTENLSPPVIKSISFSNISNKTESFTLDGKALKIKNSLNTFEITFSNSDPVGRKKYFQYRLIGLDKNWSEWTDKSKIQYSRLPAGYYRFEVRTLSSKGITTPATTVIFEIKPPWFLSTFAISLDILLILSLILLLRITYRRRKWKLQEKQLKEERQKLIQEKEHAEAEMIKLSNEKLQSEISNKNMELAKNTMLMIQKNELLIGIKNELDALKNELGYRLPNKYYVSLARQIDKGLNSENDWEMFEHLFDQAHENFFKRLKTSFPDLTTSDLRLCAYLRLNLSSKEIAPLLNISVRGVEEKRYRIRKRLGLSSDQGLSDFIVSF
jgi:cell division protein FtsB